MLCCKEKEKKASTCPTRRPRLIRQQPRSVRPPASGGTDAATRRCPPVPSRPDSSRPDPCSPMLLGHRRPRPLARRGGSRPRPGELQAGGHG